MSFVPTAHSSHVEGASYDDGTRELRVRFKDGSEHSYSGVPKSIYDGLVTSPSPGSYMNRHVKGAYPHQRGAAAD